MSVSRILFAIGVAIGAAGGTVNADPSAPRPPAAADAHSIYDDLWRIPVIYSNPRNSVIQEFRFVGRLNVDAYNLDSGFGTDQDWVVRRLRVGGKLTFLRDFLLHVEIDLDAQNPRPLYSRLTDAYLAWKPCDAFRLAVGKLSVEFGLDGATSSNELLTTERSNLSNNLYFPEQYLSGVNISGKHGAVRWNTGFYSGGTTSPEFGNFDAGNFWLGSVGYDFAKPLGVKKALLRADYVYNAPDLESDATRPLEQVAALVFQLDAEKWGLSTDVSVGRGFGDQSDAAGFVVMPWVMLTDKLQLVTRYTFISSDEPAGLRYSRYENVLARGRGDKYEEFYVGLNHYIYGHKLKLQTGWQHVNMEDSSGQGGDYSGWSWITALRLYF